MSKKFRNFRVKYQKSSIGFENLAYLQSIENKLKNMFLRLLYSLANIYYSLHVWDNVHECMFA